MYKALAVITASLIWVIPFTTQNCQPFQSRTSHQGSDFYSSCTVVTVFPLSVAGTLFSPGFISEEKTYNAVEVLILSKRHFPNPKWELLPCAQDHIMLKKSVSSRLKVSDTSNTSDNYKFHKGSYPSLQTEKQNPQLQSEENILHAKPTHQLQFTPELSQARPLFKRTYGCNYLHFILIACSHLKKLQLLSPLSHLWLGYPERS